MTEFIIGCFAGAVVGLVVMGLLASGKNDDRDMEEMMLRRENEELREKLHKRELKNIQRQAKKRGAVIGA